MRYLAQPVTLERISDTPLTPLAAPGQINLQTSLGFFHSYRILECCSHLGKTYPSSMSLDLSVKGPLLKWTFLNNLTSVTLRSPSCSHKIPICLSSMALNLVFQQAGFVSSRISPSFEEITFYFSLEINI